MHYQKIAPRIAQLNQRLSSQPPCIQARGKVTRIVGLSIEVVGTKLPIGSACYIYPPSGKALLAQVMGFDETRTYLMPVDSIEGVVPGSPVLPTGDAITVPVGDALLGRIIDGKGQPLDGKGPIVASSAQALMGEKINPLTRPRITTALDVGVRAINGLLTVGCGQRIGIFAGSGVGKSVLLGMMTQYTAADVVVVGLIGERGREVKEFIEESLQQHGLARSVVVAAPADEPPLIRLHGAMFASAIAEYFRAQGKHVLLLMDSLTRFAHAQREIALSIGEPPATRGYAPSVFSRLPQLVERAGTSDTGGSITGFYTVLAEGDDQQDPVADCARAILDGHIVLSRDLADAGHYPAIDVSQSISRVMPKVIDKTALSYAHQLKQLVATYQANRDLVAVGAYVPGTDKILDSAIRLMPKINNFLKQPADEAVNLSGTADQLRAIIDEIQAQQTQNLPGAPERSN